MSYLLCYRSRPWSDLDLDGLARFLETLGGHIELCSFYVPEGREIMLVLKYSELVHIPALDYQV